MTFENYDYVFNEYINYFNKIREKGGEYKTFGKLMVNSLYGILGMKKIMSNSFIIKKKDYSIYNKTHKIISFVELNNIMILETENELKKKIKVNINIASAITAKARIKLYNAQKDIMNVGGRLLYSDTDSIIAAFPNDLDILDKKIGSVTFDSCKSDTVIKDAVFITGKMYAIMYKNNTYIVKIKGYNQKNISFNDLKNAFYSNEDIIQNMKIIAKDDWKLKEYELTKKFSTNVYDKRKFKDGKLSTEPYIYKDFEYF